VNKRGNVLLISASREWRTYLGTVLKKQQVTYVEAHTIEEAVEISSRHHIDVLIIDFTTLNGSVTEICRTLKKEVPFRDVPVVSIILEKQLQHLDAAAVPEEFIVQRDTYDEALIRIKRVLWSAVHAINKDAISVGDLMVDVDNYEATIKGKPIYLTFKEFELLKFLLLNRGRVFSRDDLLDKVWGYDNYVGTRTVDIHVQRLRNKLGSPEGDMIITIRNVGYKFASE
jgi:two-component system alkaline phosphatase synthesis response regulator PhoP